MEQCLRDGITYFQFETLGAVDHAVFGRNGGISPAPFNSLNLSTTVEPNSPTVHENRRRAYGLFGRDSDSLVHAALKHEANVKRVSSADHGSVIPACDGIITNDSGCGLTMNYADCGSVFLYDPDNHAIGLGHAGWRGAIADLPGAMVRKMVREFNSDPERLVAALGPCISVSRYEVDEPVISQVNSHFAKWSERLLVYFDDEKIGRPHFNLPLANHIRLHDAGVPLENVELPNLCTASRTDLLFSHRAENGRTGRFGAILTLH